jgi:trimeric autotransporter adhesin
MTDEEKKELSEKIKKFASYKKILKILKSGENKFDENNLADYIYLSNIAPQEPTEEEKTCDRVNIVANKDSFIIGKSVSFSGHSINGGDYVRLVVFGPGEYSNGIEVASPKVNPKNEWNFNWFPGYSLLPGKYTFIVYDSKKRVSDEVMVKAEKGGVTIVASGAQSYYIGEKIRLAGTSTASNAVYLFIAGPNTEKEGKKIDQLSIVSKSNDPMTFVKVNVRSDCTWGYNWDASAVGTQLEVGIYTIYAVEGPFTFDNFIGKSYGSVSIIFKKPYISATCSQSTIAKGDRLYVTGTATGTNKLQIWVIGEEFFHFDIFRVNPDFSFVFELTYLIKEKLLLGQYYVIVQHPMMNNEFDVYLDESKENILYNSQNKGTLSFSLMKPIKITGFNIAKKLSEILNFPEIDDIYTSLHFFVENPVITIDTIGNKHPGDKFTITATTNLAVDDEILFQVFQSECKEKKDQFGEFFGATGVVKVIKGNSGINYLSIDIDTSPWKPDEYVVTLTTMLLDVTSESRFKIIN